MPSLKEFDPGQVVITFGPLIITGFSEDTFIVAKRDNPVFSKKVGASGEPTRIRNRDKSGSFELTLAASSSDNKALQAMADTDELSGVGVFPFMVKDLSGESLAIGSQTWIAERPEMGFGKDLGDRTWVFHTGELILKEGGNSDA